MFPVLKGCVEFILDYLVTEPDGTLTTNPSISPENNFIDPFTNKKCCLSRGSAMDISIFREVLEQFAKSAEILGLEEELSLEARIATAKLPNLKPVRTAGFWNGKKNSKKQNRGTDTFRISGRFTPATTLRAEHLLHTHAKSLWTTGFHTAAVTLAGAVHGQLPFTQDWGRHKKLTGI